MSRIVYMFLLLIVSFSSCTYYLGPNKWAKRFPETPVVFPEKVKKQALTQQEKMELGTDLFEHWANKKYIGHSNKHDCETIRVRPLLARLLLEKDIEQVNDDILKFEAWGTTGTSSKLNPKGDYDFTEIHWANLLWQFADKPNLLYPKTQEHIIHKLIIDNGSKPDKKAPKTLGLIRETENHILMKETSRYLKNQWLFIYSGQNPENDNTLNGMEAFLIEHLEEMLKTGFYEFNANPYMSFTLEALHVLHDHAHSNEVKHLTKQILDAENWQYALGSFNMNRYAPFRRRMSRVSITTLNEDRHRTFIQIYLAKHYGTSIHKDDFICCNDKALIPLLSDYQLPEQTVQFIKEKPKSYYAKIGHGMKASPEIYYGTPDYLLSAGGLKYGNRSQISPRPITLFLNDGATDINDCFHIPGSGKLNDWNNTGVYKNFAVGNHNVVIPKQYTPIETIGHWQIFKPYENKNLFIHVFNEDGFGLLYIDELRSAVWNNLFESEFFLRKTEEFISYNINSKRKWVIKTGNGKKLDRNFDKWQRIDVKFNSK